MRPDIWRQTDRKKLGTAMKNNTVIKPIMAIFIAALFFAFIFDLSEESIGTPSFAALVIISVATLVVYQKTFPATAVFHTMIAGMLLKIAYVIYTPVWCRQHDVIDFGASEGHAAYIQYILANKALPDFDPRSVWAFFQPPLHHMISAFWMWINIRLGIPEVRVYKNVQILPLIYMFILMFVVYLICKELGMRRGGTLVTMLITSFHPIFILMSGSINNDALSVMLMTVSIYLAILWYMYPTTGKIIALAFSIGLAMSAKFSSAMVAIPIGITMLYKMWNDTEKCHNRQKVCSYILELVPFAIIVFPLGLWWPIRNKILFDMPANYIPEVGESVEQAGFFSRMIDVRTASPFLYMKANGFAYDEYNLLLATLKSSLFDEGDFANISPAVTIMGWILFAAAIVILALQIIATIRTCASKESGPDAGIKLLLGTSVVVFVISYMIFALKGANLSAMNFRYSAAGIAVLAVFLGIRSDRLTALGRNISARIILISSIVFAASSAAFYILVGLLQQL